MSKHPGIIFFSSKFFVELAGNGGFDNPREPILSMADSDPRDNNQQKNDSTADLDVGRQPVQKELDFVQDDASSSPLVFFDISHADISDCLLVELLVQSLQCLSWKNPNLTIVC